MPALLLPPPKPHKLSVKPSHNVLHVQLPACPSLLCLDAPHSAGQVQPALPPKNPATHSLQIATPCKWLPALCSSLCH